MQSDVANAGMPQDEPDAVPSQESTLKPEGSLRSPPYLKAAAWLVAGCLTWLSLVYLPKDVMGPETMDPSIQGSLSYFAEKQMQFGPEVMFTYGPFGYLMPEVYDGMSFKRKLAAEFGSKIFIVAVILVIAGQLSPFRRTIFFAAVWIICPSFGHSYPEVLFYFCVAAVVPILGRAGRNRLLFLALSLLFLVFVSLIKFTSFVYSAFVIAALSVVFGYRKNWKWCALIPGAYLILLLLAWMIAGQRLGNFWVWIRTSLEIVGGYAQCMGLEPDRGVLPLAVAVLIAAFALCATGIISLRKNAIATASIIALAAGCWVSWKHGLVRADDHVDLFFGFCLLGFIAFPAFAAANFSISNVLAIIGGALCLAGLYRQDSSFVSGAPQRALTNLFENVRHLTSIPNYEAALQNKLALEKSRSECLQIKAEVDRANVDMFGYNQAIVFLNGLNYHPRPVFQTYGTYTPRLIRANADFYRSSNAPAFVISSLATVDDHFPAEDDPEALRVLLVNYRLLFAEKGWLLWRRASVIRSADEELKEIATKRVQFGEEISVPGTDIWCSIEFEEKAAGKVRNFFYKPRPLAIEFVDETQNRKVFRILPTVARTGFILDPFLLTDSDVLGLKTNFAPPPKHIVSFRLQADDVARKYFSETATVHFFTIPPLSSREDTASAAAAVPRQ